MSGPEQTMERAVLIIPAYNEAATLGDVLARVAESAPGCEVVVVDDGSRDGTGEIAAHAGATVLRHPFNLGYGAALQTGYKYARECDAALVVQMDADGQHDPAQIRGLAAGIRSGDYDLVVGSRFIETSGYRMGLLRSVGRKAFSALARLAGLRVSDPTSGFQGMNRRVPDFYARDFFPTDYPDVDVLLTAFRQGLRVGEHPVRMTEGSRESTLHGGLRSVYYVYKMLLSTFTATARTARDVANQENDQP
ncbi:MAG: glycosyltransferase family 2 protein [Deltaproteobacteria bacterium]|jgi:glycosyltransferase involved in cell wall biosynthesis|nr:glycosyltransferase family 2 protein [Deltaproteobacteria bacterium]